MSGIITSGICDRVWFYIYPMSVPERRKLKSVREVAAQKVNL